MAVAQHLNAREILSAAWPLFKACLPVCLPLAVIGVAAGATPGAEAAQTSGSRALAYTREWWALAAASTVLTLICYGAVLRQQLGLAEGERPPVLDSLRRAAADVPFVLLLLVLMAVPLVPAMLFTAWRGFGVLPALLTLLAGAVLVHGWLAWPALVAGRLGPLAALGRSVQLVRSRWRDFAQVGFALLTAVLVFVLLVSILSTMVLQLIHVTPETQRGLEFSRWLMGLILALPVVYGGAVTVTLWRAATRTTSAQHP